jgi:SAM-dependent methyltransferase
MPDPFEEARYLPLPELSPYVRTDGHDRPKEVFKHVADKLRRVTEPGRAYRLADVGCANGALLHHLRKQFPDWRFDGFDLTPEFIAAARAFAPLAGVGLHVQDLYAIDQRFEIVTMINLLTALGEPEEPFAKLLSLVEPGGLLLVEGCFNEYDVEFRAVFMDNSRPESRGKWRRDYSQHSRQTIARLLAGRCRSFEFDPLPMIDLPRRPEAPHTNVWTFRDEHGRVITTNGTHLMLEKSLLTVHV